MRKIYPLIIFVLVLASCQNHKPADYVVTGYKPIYKEASDDTLIYLSSSPTSITNAGKIIVSGNRIFMVESGRGIHIMDLPLDSVPTHLGFLNVPGCSDLALKENHLYVNNLKDLVVLDIKNLYDIKIKKRIPNTFRDIYNQSPPYSNTYFECIDTSKGMIIGWEEAELTNPKCFKI